MWVLLSAVLAASLLGSTHCVGMCGPLAIFATGASAGSEGPAKRRVVLRSTLLYHLGRLSTYLVVGSLAGMLGSVADIAGGTLGIQLAAARIVGTLMILIGGLKLFRHFFDLRKANQSHSSSIAKALVKLRPLILQFRPSGRAVMVGLLTTLLLAAGCIYSR